MIYILVNYTQYTINVALYTIQCTIYTVQCTIYSVQCIVYIIQYTVCFSSWYISALVNLDWEKINRTRKLNYTLVWIGCYIYTLYYVHCTSLCSMYNVHYIQYTRLYSVPHTVGITYQYIVHPAKTTISVILVLHNYCVFYFLLCTYVLLYTLNCLHHIRARGGC